MKLFLSSLLNFLSSSAGGLAHNKPIPFEMTLGNAKKGIQIKITAKRDAFINFLRIALASLALCEKKHSIF
jgi:hypothetical protein